MYTRAANMNVTQTLGPQWAKRLHLAFLSLNQDYLFRAKTVTLYRETYEMINATFGGSELIPMGFFSRPLVIMELLKDVENRVANIQPGEALIAHLLLPHFPYILTPECDLKSVSEWTFPLREFDLDKSNEAYAGFWDQTKCTSKIMAPILKLTGQRDDIVVIIHGDHGARIIPQHAEEHNPASLGTFLAVKSPYHVSGLTTDTVNLQQVFKDEFIAIINAVETK
jgi:hypothetical protein